MAQVTLICGKICAGKTTFAKRLQEKHPAVLLSCDELTLLLGQYLGDAHDTVTKRVQAYLYEKSVETVNAGISVILDWGFWTKASREEARRFYESRQIPYAFYFLDIDDQTWRAHLEKRNRAVLTGETNSYLVDDNLIAKCAALFEPPDHSEDCLRAVDFLPDP